MPLTGRSAAPVATRYGLARFNDNFTDADLDVVVDYFTRPDPHLDTLIDRARMPDAAALRARYESFRWSGSADQMAAMFMIRIDEKLAGLTILLRRTPDENYSHWHVFEPEHRGGGLSSAIYPRRLQLYFDNFAINRLIHQTRVSNLGVNRMLDKFVPVTRTEHVEKPDGLSKPGEFHIRHVDRADLPGILARAGVS